MNQQPDIGGNREAELVGFAFHLVRLLLGHSDHNRNIPFRLLLHIKYLLNVLPFVKRFFFDGLNRS